MASGPPWGKPWVPDGHQIFRFLQLQPSTHHRYIRNHKWIAVLSFNCGSEPTWSVLTQRAEGLKEKIRHTSEKIENWFVCNLTVASCICQKCSPEKVAIAPMVGLEVLQVCLLAIKPMGEDTEGHQPTPEIHWWHQQTQSKQVVGSISWQAIFRRTSQVKNWNESIWRSRCTPPLPYVHRAHQKRINDLNSRQTVTEIALESKTLGPHATYWFLVRLAIPAPRRKHPAGPEGQGFPIETTSLFLSPTIVVDGCLGMSQWWWNLTFCFCSVPIIEIKCRVAFFKYIFS